MKLFNWRRVLITLAVVATGTGLLSPGMAQAAVSITTSASSVTDTSAVLTWDYTAGLRPADFIRVGRDGTDASGNGPWFQDVKPPADGSLTFTNLKPGTAYKLYAEVWRGTTKLTQSTSPITTTGGTTPPPPPPPPSGGTPFDYGATGATNTTVRATVNPSGQGSGNTTDATAINNAITAASNAAGGGIVHLNAGQYYENSVKIINKPNVRLEGPAVAAGAQPTAVIKAGPGFLTGSQYGGYPMITNTLGASNMTVANLLLDQSGDTLNGNVSGRLSAYLLEFRQAGNVIADHVWTRRPFTYSIVFADTTKFGVRNADTQVNTSGKYDQLDGIHVLQSHNGDVVDNHVDQAFNGATDGDDGLVAHTIGATTDHINFRNNVVRGGGHGHSLQLAGGSYDISYINITGNEFDCTGAATKAGVRFGYYGSATSKVDHITIGGAPGAGNHFTGCTAFAVKLTDGPAFNSTVTYNKADATTGPYFVPAGNGNVVANNTIG